MELFRSQDMKYLAVTMTNEAAHATVRELGKLALSPRHRRQTAAAQRSAALLRLCC